MRRQLSPLKWTRDKRRDGTHCRTQQALKLIPSQLTTAVSSLQFVMPQAMVMMCKVSFSDTTLMEAAFMTARGVFIDKTCNWCARRYQCCKIHGLYLPERYIEALQHKPERPFKFVVKFLSNTRIQIEHIWPGPAILTKVAGLIFSKIRLTRWTSTPRLQIVKKVPSIFYAALQARYFKLISGIKAAMFNFPLQLLGELV